jgi:transposase
MKQRRVFRYDLEFKRQAVLLSSQPGVLTQDVARELDIHPFMLCRWKKELREGDLVGREPSIPPSADLVEANRRIRELERELERTRAENDLLKKALEFLKNEKKPGSDSSSAT